MAKHKILVSRVVHTPAGFLVFNAGETADVPAEHVDTFRADGNIAGGAADAADEPTGPVSLTGKNKAQLLDIAKTESVTVADDATNAQIVEAIEAKRAGGSGAEAPTE